MSTMGSTVGTSVTCAGPGHHLAGRPERLDAPQVGDGRGQQVDLARRRCGPGPRRAGPRRWRWSRRRRGWATWPGRGGGDEEPGVVAPGGQLRGDPVADVVARSRRPAPGPPRRHDVEQPGASCSLTASRWAAKRVGHLGVAGVEQRSPTGRRRAGGRASITPASSKHSRRAATQKASPPESTPRMALASASVRPRHRASAAGPVVLGIDRPPGEHIGPGHELGGQVPAEHAHLDGRAARPVRRVPDQHHRGGVADGDGHPAQATAGQRRPAARRPGAVGRPRARRRSRPRPIGGERPGVDQRADGQLAEAGRGRR